MAHMIKTISETNNCSVMTEVYRNKPKYEAPDVSISVVPAEPFLTASTEPYTEGNEYNSNYFETVGKQG